MCILYFDQGLLSFTDVLPIDEISCFFQELYPFIAFAITQGSSHVTPGQYSIMRSNYLAKNCLGWGYLSPLVTEHSFNL